MLPTLDESLENLRKSIKSKNEAQHLEADDFLQNFISLLPELFAGRDLGNGFGAIVLGIFHAIKNSASTPLDIRQTKAVFEAIDTLRREPYISHLAAVDILIGVEGVGLVPHPVALDVISETFELGSADEEGEKSVL